MCFKCSLLQLLCRKPAAKKKTAALIDSDSDDDKNEAPRNLSNISEDDWLKITGQKSDTGASQSTENDKQSDSGSKHSKK